MTRIVRVTLNIRELTVGASQCLATSENHLRDAKLKPSKLCRDFPPLHWNTYDCTLMERRLKWISIHFTELGWYRD